jgi:RNA polymerase sigma factor (sigma-70 family)
MGRHTSDQVGFTGERASSLRPPPPTDDTLTSRQAYGIPCETLLAVLRSASTPVPDPRLDGALRSMRREWIRIARARLARLGDDTEDAVQVALMKVLSADKLSTLADASALERWARSIFVNTALDYLRDAQRRGRRQASPPDFPDAGTDWLDRLPTPEPDPEERVRRAERLAIIRGCLRELDDAWLRYAEDLPEREVAARVGASRAAVATRLKRFRRWLRERLDETP